MMSLRENIEDVLSKYSEGMKIIEYWTSSVDGHEEVNEYVLRIDSVISYLESHLESVIEYGNSEGIDPKGHWIKIVKYELIEG